MSNDKEIPVCKKCCFSCGNPAIVSLRILENGLYMQYCLTHLEEFVNIKKREKKHATQQATV